MNGTPSLPVHNTNRHALQLPVGDPVMMPILDLAQNSYTGVVKPQFYFIFTATCRVFLTYIYVPISNRLQKMGTLQYMWTVFFFWQACEQSWWLDNRLGYSVPLLILLASELIGITTVPLVAFTMNQEVVHNHYFIPPGLYNVQQKKGLISQF